LIDVAGPRRGGVLRFVRAAEIARVFVFFVDDSQDASTSTRTTSALQRDESAS